MTHLIEVAEIRAAPQSFPRPLLDRVSWRGLYPQYVVLAGSALMMSGAGIIPRHKVVLLPILTKPWDELIVLRRSWHSLFGNGGLAKANDWLTPRECSAFHDSYENTIVDLNNLQVTGVLTLGLQAVCQRIRHDKKSLYLWQTEEKLSHEQHALTCRVWSNENQQVCQIDDKKPLLLLYTALPKIEVRRTDFREKNVV